MTLRGETMKVNNPDVIYMENHFALKQAHSATDVTRLDCDTDWKTKPFIPPGVVDKVVAIRRLWLKSA